MIGELVLILCLSALAGLAWYPCCCPTGSAYPCVNCSGDVPDTISVTLAGAANNRCDTCDTTLDGTHILLGFNRCTWIKENTNLGCSSPSVVSYYSMRATVTTGSIGIAGKTQWWFYVMTTTSEPPIVYTTTSYHYWDSGFLSPIDCTADRTLSRYPVAGGLCCSFTGLTVSLEPG